MYFLLTSRKHVYVYAPILSTTHTCQLHANDRIELMPGPGYPTIVRDLSTARSGLSETGRCGEGDVQNACPMNMAAQRVAKPVNTLQTSFVPVMNRLLNKPPMIVTAPRRALCHPISHDTSMILYVAHQGQGNSWFSLRLTGTPTARRTKRPRPAFACRDGRGLRRQRAVRSACRATRGIGHIFRRYRHVTATLTTIGRGVTTQRRRGGWRACQYGDPGSAGLAAGGGKGR